jgi:Ca2+-binding EF-hand superfamily protein
MYNYIQQHNNVLHTYNSFLAVSDFSPHFFTCAAEMASVSEAEILEAFAMFDLQGKGELSSRAAKVGLRALGLSTRKKDIVEMVEKLRDIDAVQESAVAGEYAVVCSRNDDGVTAKEFVAIAFMLDKKRNRRAELEQAFDLFCRSGELEMLTVEDLIHVGLENGREMTLEHAQELIDEGDLQGKGGLTRIDFMNMMDAYLNGDLDYIAPQEVRSS